MKKPAHKRWLTIAIALTGATWLTSAAAEEVTVAYQYGADPAKLAQIEGRYEKATGWKINWKRFDSGADIVTAIASGDVQIGNIGSSPLAASTSRGLPIKAFVVNALTGGSEALVVRNGAGISKPQDFAGKTIATPFVSTAHYSLLSALKHWKVDPTKTKIVNLAPPEIFAAWQRGDIDAAYTWDPALGKIKQSGKVLTDSAEVGKWGSPTFDSWVVRKDFAASHPDFVTKFAKVTLDVNAEYRKNASKWTANSDIVKKISDLSGATPEDIPALLAGNKYPVASEQLSAAILGGGSVKAITATAAFLKEQKKIDQTLPSYTEAVDAQFVRKAASLK
ncbi:taurine ABC transporter substrate-binding protein [Leeia oryzae]|uniref:taurine ABC transporter substrate-binding protein n=1 Tax=Leeia oryzae TaxID=356662 RepID=UPI00036817FB|nr:taurine ABC transporter substrate-binding protein [Leeia oryzae]